MNVPKWIGDGSDGGQLDVNTSAASSMIIFSSATQGTPFNIRLVTDHATLGRSYYEVKVIRMSEGASLSVGLVSAYGFQPGWKTEGCFYNGNITNGSAGLIIGFGERIKEGDTVGAYSRRNKSQTTCDIIYYHNGRCLGAGFSLEDNANDMYYPCLHLSGSATVEFSIPPSPKVFEREEPPMAEGGDVYGGDWAIDKVFSGQGLNEMPLPETERKFKVTFWKEEGNLQHYGVGIKISNSLRTSLAITGKMEAFDKIKFIGGCISTRMMPRPEFRELEYLMASALDDESKDGDFQKMIVTEEGNLIMSGPTVKIICSRYVETFEPMTSINS